MSNDSQIWFPYYTFLEQETSQETIAYIHYYMSRSPTSTGPPQPFATMPLLRPGENATETSEIIGQISMQGMKLTIQRGPQYYRRNRLASEETVDIEDDGAEVIWAKDAEEQKTMFRKHFGIEGYMDNAILVLKGDDEW
ncbi:hypothetical protein FBU30_003899 [Linnemannia zychae]|nr:hypothetical protein FBU30_003899 [Linnemannia zychae]